MNILPSKLFFKRTAWFLLLLVVLFVVAYQGILRTDTGSRWALGFVTGQWLPELSYQDMTGNLSQGITLKKVRYEDSSASVTVAELKTGELSLSYWQPALVLSQLKVKDTSLRIKETTAVESTKPMQWQGFALPFDVDVNGINVSGFTLDQEAPFHVASLSTALKVRDDVWTINKLNIAAEGLKFLADAKIQSNEQLNMTLSGDLSWQTENIEWQANLGINGDKNQLLGNLTQYYKDDVLDGHLQSQFKLEDLFGALKFEVITVSENLKLTAAEDQLLLNLSELMVKGNVDAYQISGQAEIQSEQFNQVSTTWQAEGDLNGLNIESLNLGGDAGDMSLKGTVDWADGFALVSKVQSVGLNPAWINKDWPGQLDAYASVNLKWHDANEWDVKVPQLEINGQLKNAPLSLIMAGHSGVSGTQTQQSEGSVQGSWGNNAFNLIGRHEGVNSKWQLNSDLNLKQMTLIEPKLAGELTGTVVLDGVGQTAHIEARLKGKSLTYDQHQVETFGIDVAADLGATSDGKLSVNTNMQDVLIAGETINSLTVNVDGLVKDHQMAVKIEASDVRSEALITGNYDHTNKQYTGTLNQHEVSLNDFDVQWGLVNVVAFELSPVGWHLDQSCWQQQTTVDVADTSELCVDVKSSKNGQIAGQLALSQVDLSKWSFLLPQGFSGSGQLEGDMSFELMGSDVNVDAQLEMTAGSLLVESLNGATLDGKTQKLKFSKGVLSAQQINDQSKVQFDLALDDGSFLNLNALLKVNQADSATTQLKPMQRIYLEGDFDGYLADNDMISGFFDEIKQVEGQLNVSGQVKGPLNQPQVFAQISLEEGDIDLKSVDVPLSQVKAEIQSISKSNFHYLVSAQAGNGQLTVAGDLLFIENQPWQLTSEVRGKNFLVAEGEQINLSISPQLNIKYADALTEVSGELRIPQASINVQEMPVTVTTLSSDVVYVGDQSGQQDGGGSNLLIDIKAIIEEKVKLEVLGLTADLSGALQLKNGEQKQDIKAFGQLNITDGVYEIYGQKLNITQGLLIFDGPIDNPILQVRAERKAQDEQIVGIKLSGDVNNYKTTLFANPPLNDAETLSYIVTGKGLNNLEGSGDSDKIAEAVLMMGLRQNSELISGLKNGLGIDVLSVTNQSETGATVEAGKNLGDKVFVGYNQGIFKHIGYWLLRYQINDKLSLETKQGEEQSVDLVYRREKK
ncbi:translocation/assembly module TamB domain-containing protein [Marinicella rhabdoformis]|uniref:translocation/assembly module TamB domain-containing protein n=1 Tax=Marinicella rhabdoformis TaxID=2580566 RepID=UPI0012AED7BA|nr:translocation/assembly module TamB domain-containing protein [Marinicella rhabdoformis]